MSSDGWAENIVSDHQVGARLERKVALGGGDENALHAAAGVDDKVRERPNLLTVEADLLPAEVGECTPRDRVVPTLAVEQEIVESEEDSGPLAKAAPRPGSLGNAGAIDGGSNVVGGVTSFGTNFTCKGHNGAYRVDQPDDLAWLATFGLTPG